MSARTDTPLGMAEIAELCDMTVSNVKRLRAAGHFPEPDGILAMGPYWLRSTITQWKAVPRPAGRRRRESNA